MKKHVLGRLAKLDIEQAFYGYMSAAGADVALDFADAVDLAIVYVEKHPAAGSPRYKELLNATGLRSWLTARFPYIVIYVEKDDYLEIVRVLHQHADIPAHLDDDNNGQE